MLFFFFFSSRRRHTRSLRDWSSDVCSSDLHGRGEARTALARQRIVLERRQHGRRGDGLEIRGSAFTGAVLGGDDFSLLGNPYAAPHRAVRLGADRRTRRTPAPAHGPAAAVEDLHGSAEFLEYRRERTRGLVQAPYR